MTLAEIEAQAKQRLAAAGFRVDYFSLRRAEDLTLPKHAERHLVILAAAYLGQTRLIDNLCVDG